MGPILSLAAPLTLLAAIAFASVLAGRAIVGAAGIELLRRLTPESAAASAIVGTAGTVVVFGWLTLAGMHAPQIVVGLLILLIGLLLAAKARDRLDVFRPRGAPVGWLGLGAAWLVAGVLALLPVLRSGDFVAGNDTFIYCAFSEHLQREGLRTPTDWDPLSPITYFPHAYQRSGLRLGATYLLAAAQAATSTPSSLLVYPAVSAWGLLLLVAGVFVALRWALRLPAGGTAGAVLAFSLLPHAAYWSHHNGFLSQLFGLASLLLEIAVLARAAHDRHWRGGTALLLALVAAFLVSVYLPLLPVLGAAGACWAWAGTRRAEARGLRRPWLAFLGLVALTFAVLAHRDLLAIVRGLRVLTTVRVGGPLSAEGWDRLAFAMGTLGTPLGALDPAVAAFSRLAAVAASVLAALGIARIARVPRAWSLLATVCVLLALIGYYALVAIDPWTLERGHGWDVLKLLKWIQPSLFLLQAAGFCTVPMAPRRVLAGVLPLLLVVLALPAHKAWSRPNMGSLERVTQAARPLEQVMAMKDSLRRLPEGTLLLAGRPADRDPWLGPYLALLAYPRALAAEWEASAYIELHRELAERDARLSSVRLLLVACLPSRPGAAPIEELGWGCARYPTDEPLIVGVSGRRQLRYGTGPLRVLLFSPRQAEGQLLFGDGVTARAVRLRPGLTRVELHPQEAPGLAVGDVHFVPAVGR